MSAPSSPSSSATSANTGATAPVFPTASPTPPAPAASRSLLGRWDFSSPLWRLGLIALLLFLLGIPAAMIREVVRERESRRTEAVADITSKWGLPQHFTGALLRVPYTVREVEKDKDGKETISYGTQYAYFLPNKLDIHADLQVETRARGIFTVPVYQVQLSIRGGFAAPDLADLAIPVGALRLKDAELMFSITDPRALQSGARLVVDGKAQTLMPAGLTGTGLRAVIGSDINAEQLWAGKRFELNVKVNGSDAIAFYPTGEQTNVTLKGNWAHPSFSGDWLPTERNISDTHFDAAWSVSHLGRNLPQQWASVSRQFDPRELQSFGVSLRSPMDPYAMADRISKYAALILTATFAVVWLMEVLYRVRLHPIQYGFLGAALSIFALLQLSAAEHFGFATAYAASALAVVALVGAYSYSALKTGGKAALVTSVLAGLYGYLYSVLQAEDYALLAGSIALFAGLAATMWLTRNVSWGRSPETASAS